MLAMRPVWDIAPHPSANDREAPGSFREHDIQPFPGGMRPPSWVHVAADVNAWLEDINRSSPTRPRPSGQLAASTAGSSRSIRSSMATAEPAAVSTSCLCRLGYPPAIIFKRQRTDYLRALRRADSGEPGFLGELLARAILDNLYKFVVPAIAGPARLVPIDALQTDDVDHERTRVAAPAAYCRRRRAQTAGGEAAGTGLTTTVQAAIDAVDEDENDEWRASVAPAEVIQSRHGLPTESRRPQRHQGAGV